MTAFPPLHQFFDAAALDRTAFHPITPERVPLEYADERAAWEGHLDERPDLTFHVDAAAYHGRVVFFGITGPWTRSARSEPAPPSRFDRIVQGLAGLIMPGLMIAGALLARHNLRLQRGDHTSAARAATFPLWPIATCMPVGSPTMQSCARRSSSCRVAIRPRTPTQPISSS